MRFNKGMISAATAYILWGVFPIYFKLLQQVPAVQIVAHRIVWSFAFLLLIVAFRKEFKLFRSALNPRTVLIFLAAAVLLSVNWLVYVWGVNAGFVVETSLGYFINPLVNVLLGVVFLHEKLRPAQWAPVGLAAAGVIYLTLSFGSLPWIALVLAFSFGMYGLIKKTAPLGSLFGLTLETTLLVVPALGYLVFVELFTPGVLQHASFSLIGLLSLSGFITAVPLLLFASGARSVPLSVMGLLQYVAPTLQFLIGVLVYNEPFTQARLIGFSIIWFALLVFTGEGFWHWRKSYPLPSNLAARRGM